MKRTIILSVMLLVGLIARAQDLTQQAAQAFASRDYYTLRELCLNHAEQINPVALAMVQPVVAFTFNRYEEAETAFNALFQEHTNDIGLENVMQMAYLTSRNYEVQQKYEFAANTCRQIVEIVESIDEVPNEAADAFRENQERYTELAKYPVTTLDAKADGWTIPFTLVQKEQPKPTARISIAATINGHEADVMFDTGMGINAISPEYAAKLGLTPIGAQSLIKGGGMLNTGMAIAETMMLGDMQLHNILFAVVELKSGDEEMDKNIDVNIIIGGPIMRLMKELTMDFEQKRITVPAVPNAYDEPNITFSPSDLLLQARCRHQGEPIDMNIDTGATGEWAHLDASYYAAHQAELDAIADEEEDRLAGIGGFTIERKKVLRDFALNVGGKDCIIPKILASKQANDQAAIARSALGMLFFSNQRKVTISIPYSKIVVESR